MSGEEAANRATRRAASGPVRLRHAWRALPSDRRLAAAAALGLFATLFLPWYQETGLAKAGSKVQTTTASLTGWAAFSWVEAAVLLVALCVLALLFLRAEGRAFHLPGGDGAIVTIAGGWTCLLVIWRIFDKQGVTSRGQFATTAGIEWGIFVTLGIAGMLAYAGSRIRAAHEPEPPLPGDDPTAADAEPWSEHEASAPGAGAPTRRLRRRERTGARRATWAEPVTWDEPEALAEPPTLAAPAAPTHAAEPIDGAAQLTIPFDDEQP